MKMKILPRSRPSSSSIPSGSIGPYVAPRRKMRWRFTSVATAKLVSRGFDRRMWDVLMLFHSSLSGSSVRSKSRFDSKRLYQNLSFSIGYVVILSSKNNRKDARTRRLTAIPMKTPRSGSFCKGYSPLNKRVSLVHVLLNTSTDQRIWCNPAAPCVLRSPRLRVRFCPRQKEHRGREHLQFTSYLRKDQTK